MTREGGFLAFRSPAGRFCFLPFKTLFPAEVLPNPPICTLGLIGMESGGLLALEGPGPPLAYLSCGPLFSATPPGVGNSGVEERALIQHLGDASAPPRLPLQKEHQRFRRNSNQSHPTARTGAAPTGRARADLGTHSAPSEGTLLLPALDHSLPVGGQCSSPLLALGTPLFLDPIPEHPRIKESLAV